MAAGSERISLYYLKPESTAPPPRNREGELLRLALALNEGSSARDIVDMLFRTLGDVVPCDRIGVALLEPDGWLVSKVVVSRYPIIVGEGYRGRLSGSSLEPILRKQQIRVIHDLEAYAREHPRSTSTAQLVAEGMRSSLTLPLISKHQAVGVMFFTSTQRGAYGGEHIGFLRAIASGVAIALERSRMTDELRQALIELKSLDQLKTNFLSNLSHELRTPLSIVLGYLQTLEDESAGTLTQPQHGLLGKAIGAAERLNSLLNDLFDFTELTSGILHLNCQPVDLSALLEDLVDDFRLTLEGSGLTLDLALPEAPLTVQGDPPRLAKAICKLLDNARKFTPAPGAIHVRAGRTGDEVWVEVADTGIGIPLEHQRQIFGTFYQVESGPNRTYGGAGLGLALARSLVEAHGGRLSMRSTPGKGSVFRIALPA